MPQLDLIGIVRRGLAAWLFCALLSAQLDTRWFGTLRSSEAAPLVPATSNSERSVADIATANSVTPVLRRGAGTGPGTGTGPDTDLVGHGSDDSGPVDPGLVDSASVDFVSAGVGSRMQRRHSAAAPSNAAPISVLSVSIAALPGTAPILAELSRYEFTEPHMGTTVRLVLYAKDEAQAVSASRAGFERVAALDRALSDYQPASELMRLCARAGQGPVPVSDDLFRVLAAAQDLAVRSHGAFDVTAGPLTRLWRGARRLSELPDPARIAAARARTGHDRLRLDAAARTATLTEEGMTLDVGGIAKGYAADEALRALESEGVTRALVAIGGDIAVSEPPPGHDAWTVDVASLDIPGAPHLGALRLRHAAVSTAGDAEQWMTANGQRYSHILDPRTGWPMTIRSSTTVIAPHGLDADGLDTAAAILGAEDGLKLVEATDGAAVFMVREEPDGRITVHTSSRWPSSHAPWPAAAAPDTRP
jgi:thiamine biosynthesis lipoprotein